MQRRFRHTRSGPNPGRAVTRRVRDAFVVGFIATALIGAVAPTAFATTNTEVGVANNIYSAMTEQDMRQEIELLESFTPFTFNSSAQIGGYWNKSPDTTTMRGVTSGSLRQQLRSAGPYTTCDPSTQNCVNGPLHIDAFMSADEGNVNQVIPNGSNGGTCVASGSVECNGVAGSKHAVAIGHLVIYSCNSTHAGDGDDPSNGAGLPFGADANGSGNGKPQSPRCDASPVTDAPGGGAPENMSEVVTWLATSGHRIAVADPASAPFGAASKQALTQNGFTWTESGAGQNVFRGSACDSAGAACKVRLESGITQVRGAVTSDAGGNTQLGLVAKSNVLHVSWTSGSLNGTTGNDPNTWVDIPSTAYSGYGPIQQYGVALNGGNTGAAAAWNDLFTNNWDSDTTIQSTLNAYGYN